MSGNAARASRTVRLERQIVVLLIQRLRERVERFGGFPAGFGNCSGPSSCPSSDGSGSASRTQHDQLARDDLSDVARLLIVVFPGPVFDPALYIDLVTLLQVLLAHVGQTRTGFVIPADNSMPVRLFLLFAPVPRPLPAGRDGEGTGAKSRKRRTGIELSAGITKP